MVIPLEDASRGCGLASTCCHFPRYLMYSVNSATGVTCSKIAHKTDQSIPTYKAIYRIVRGLPKDLLVLAHEGTKAYAEAFDLIHRREATQKLKQIDIRDAKCLTAARWVLAQLRRADLSAWANADPILGVRRVLPSPLNIIADHTRSLS